MRQFARLKETMSFDIHESVYSNFHPEDMKPTQHRLHFVEENGKKVLKYEPMPFFSKIAAFFGWSSFNMKNVIKILSEIQSSPSLSSFTSLQKEQFKKVAQYLQTSIDKPVRKQRNGKISEIYKRQLSEFLQKVDVRPVEIQDASAQQLLTYKMEQALLLNATTIVPQLLKDGADPNGRDSNHRPFLSLALASNVDPTVVKMLLDHGADPACIDPPNPTSEDFVRFPLFYACCLRDNQSFELVKTALLQKQQPLIPPFFSTDAQKKRLLELAALWHHNPAIVKALLDEGVEPSILSILRASGGGKLGPFRALWDAFHRKPPQTIPDGSHLLHTAITGLNPEIVSFLLNQEGYSVTNALMEYCLGKARGPSSLGISLQGRANAREIFKLLCARLPEGLQSKWQDQLPTQTS